MGEKGENPRVTVVSSCRQKGPRAARVRLCHRVRLAAPRAASAWLAEDHTRPMGFQAHERGPSRARRLRVGKSRRLCLGAVRNNPGLPRDTGRVTAAPNAGAWTHVRFYYSFGSAGLVAWITCCRAYFCVCAKDPFQVAAAGRGPQTALLRCFRPGFAASRALGRGDKSPSPNMSRFYPNKT